MKAKSANQSVREALQVLRLATISRQNVVVDKEGKLVYARGATAAGGDMDATQALTAKIERELSHHAKGLDEVREYWIPHHLPSLASVRNASGHRMLAAIESLTVEWQDFVKTHDRSAHHEWQQTQLRRDDFLQQVAPGMPLGVQCSAEDGVIAASTFTLSREDTALLLERLTNSPYGEIDPELGIARQTVKDAPRSESIRITLPGSANGRLKPSTLELSFPKPEALVGALQALYDRRQEIMGDAATPAGNVAQADHKANFVKLASLLTNQTAMNLLDDFRYQANGGASDATVIFNTRGQAETILVSLDANGDLIVDRARWERWVDLICQETSQQALPVNRGQYWEGPLNDTNFSYRAHISFKLGSEDIEQGVFRPAVTRSPQLSACIEMDWQAIDPMLRRAANDRRQRSSQSSDEFTPRT